VLLGLAVGDVLGWADGAALVVGGLDGPELGRLLGDTEGEVLGRRLGASLGVEDGDVLGRALGVKDGDVLGRALGGDGGGVGFPMAFPLPFPVLAHAKCDNANNATGKEQAFIVIERSFMVD